MAAVGVVVAETEGVGLCTGEELGGGLREWRVLPERDCKGVRVAELQALPHDERESVRVGGGERLPCGEAEGVHVKGSASPVVAQPPQGQGVGAPLPAGQKLPMGQMKAVALHEPAGQ